MMHVANYSSGVSDICLQVGTTGGAWKLFRRSMVAQLALFHCAIAGGLVSGRDVVHLICYDIVQRIYSSGAGVLPAWDDGMAGMVSV